MDSTAVKTKMTYAQAAGENWTRTHSGLFATMSPGQIQSLKADYISDVLCCRTEEIKADFERTLGCVITD